MGLQTGRRAAAAARGGPRAGGVTCGAAAQAARQGVQIYTCKASAGDQSKNSFDAAHAEPDAALTDADGQWMVHHYLNLDPAGPAWEARDGSIVVGRKLDLVQTSAGTIPWPKLEVVAHEGHAPLRRSVTFIQRVDTQGGAAPTGDCEPARTPRVRVPYEETYYFYGPKP